MIKSPRDDGALYEWMNEWMNEQTNDHRACSFCHPIKVKPLQKQWNGASTVLF